MSDRKARESWISGSKAIILVLAVLTATFYQLDVQVNTDSVEFTALNAAIIPAQSLNPLDYTQSAWNDVQIALSAAQVVQGNVANTQAEVDIAANSLTTAIAVLINLTALNTAIASAQALKSADYTPAIWSPVQTALTTAKSNYDRNTNPCKSIPGTLTAGFTMAHQA